MPTRGLPGFLRRSLRVEYDDEEEEDADENDNDKNYNNNNNQQQYDHHHHDGTMIGGGVRNENETVGKYNDDYDDDSNDAVHRPIHACGSSSQNSLSSTEYEAAASSVPFTTPSGRSTTTAKNGTIKYQQHDDAYCDDVTATMQTPMMDFDNSSTVPQHRHSAEDQIDIAYNTPAAAATATAANAAPSPPAPPSSSGSMSRTTSRSKQQSRTTNNNNNNKDGSEGDDDMVKGQYLMNELLLTSPSPLQLQDEEEPKLTFRELQFEKVLIQPDVVNLSELRKLGWNGIPVKYRASCWKIMLGYVPTNKQRRQQSLQRKRSEYRSEYRQQHYHIDEDSRTLQEQETLRQVLVDVPRTAPEIPLFRNDRIKRMLTRLLYIWAMRHPASSYVQGINDLATPLIVVFLADYYDGQDVLHGDVMNHLSDERLDDLEADVYWCLTSLLAGIQDHYTSDQPGVQRMVMRLQELVNRIDASLCRHLRDMGIEFLQFSFKWMNCLLLREFHLRCVPRLWDTYISETNGFEDFHVYVCAAFLCQFSAQLQEMTFDELFAFFQDVPTQEWSEAEVEILLSQAFVLSTLFKGSDAHLTNTNTAIY